MSSKALRVSLAVVSGVVLVASGLYAVNVVVFGEESDECSEQAEIARDEAGSSGVAQIFSGSNAYDVGNYPALEGYSDGGAPVVWIANNPSFDDSERKLYLLAYAWDVEDGWLGGDAFVWHSSLDGTVGADSKFAYRRNSPGCHVITVFATDSDGLVGAAKTVIRAGLPNSAPIAAADVVSSSLSERIVFDVVDNDFDLERNIDTSTLRIIDPPELGQAEVIDPRASEEPSYYWYRYYDVRVEFRDEGNVGLLWYEGIIPGLDSLTYEVCDIHLSCDTATVHIYSGFADCTILGTEGDDVLYGDNEDNIICGLGGDDIIYGNNGIGGDDVIYGGPGDDIIYGKNGDDVIYGGPGEDIIYGKNGDDVIYGGPGEDHILAGYGRDSVLGGSGDDVIYGGQGQDIINGRNRNEISIQDDRVYHDFTDIDDVSIGLSEMEEKYIDIVSMECNDNIKARFSAITSLCGEMARNLCLSRIAIDMSRQQSASEARLATMDFLCQAAHLAEKATLAYVLRNRYRLLYSFGGGYPDFFAGFRESIESDFIELPMLLDEIADLIPNQTHKKLSHLLEALINFGSPDSL